MHQTIVNVREVGAAPLSLPLSALHQPTPYHAKPDHQFERAGRVPIPHDATLYRQRHRIEDMFGRLEDWHHIQTRYDRRAHPFFSTISTAAKLRQQ